MDRSAHPSIHPSMINGVKVKVIGTQRKSLLDYAIPTQLEVRGLWASSYEYWQILVH